MKHQCTREHPSFYALTSLFPSISRYKRSGNTRAAKSGDSDDTTGPGPEDSRAVRKLTFIPSNTALPKAVVIFNGSQKELRSFTAALLVHLGPLIAWILETAPTHFASLSITKKKQVKSAELAFRDAYGDVGTMLAQQHILQILVRVFQDLPPTTHLMRAETLYNYGSSATTDVWDAIFVTYHAKSNFVCNEIMQLLKILQTFDGSNFMDLQADINSLLDQIAVEQIGIRDLVSMCLVVGVKHAGREEPLFREAYYQIIQTKSINYVQIMPPRLQIAFLLSLLVSRTPLMFFSRTPITSH